MVAELPVTAAGIAAVALAARHFFASRTATEAAVADGVQEVVVVVQGAGFARPGGGRIERVGS